MGAETCNGNSKPFGLSALKTHKSQCNSPHDEQQSHSTFDSNSFRELGRMLGDLTVVKPEAAS